MCHTAFQKYTGCHVFRQHYIYRDIQCEEMQMWSKLFKKEVWCRRIYEQGTTAFADEESRAGPPNFPAPIAGMELPPRLTCHQCNAVRRLSKRSAVARHGKKRPQATPTRRMSIVVRRSLAGACQQDIRADKPVSAISYTISPLQALIFCTRAVPKAFAYNLLRICAKAKW